jgi:hypothetical protein
VRRPTPDPKGATIRPRRPRLSAAVVSAALVAALAVASGNPSTAAPEAIPSFAFGPTGVDGGGFQNAVALGPGGELVLGGDVSGFSVTSNGGTTWAASNAGVPAIAMRAVASVAFSPIEVDTIYAAVGFRGKNGGFLASTDGGASWVVRSTVPQFSGSSNTGGGLPTTHPRSTGSLIAVDPDRSLIYVGTFDDGVMRSADGGRTWTRLGLAGTFIRSLVLDPSDPALLYAATYGERTWRGREVHAAATFQQLAASPASVEELAFVGADLYAAAGRSGLYRVTDAGQTWNRLGDGSLPATGPAWSAIGGVAGCGGTALYAGSHAGGGTWSLARSPDGGATWLPVSASSIRTTVGGPSGPTWWLSQKKPAMMLGGTGFTAGQLVVIPPSEPCGPEQIVIAGRSGVWASRDAGATWYPIVDGLGTTITFGVAADPTVPGRVTIGVSDWGHLLSTDGVESVSMVPPGGVTDAYDVAIDTTTAPARVALGVGHTSRNANGEVFSSTDPPSTPWIDEGLSNATGGRRVFALATGLSSTGSRVVIAAAEASGVWRKVGGGGWKKANTAAMTFAQKTKGANLVWPSGGTTVYLYDRQTGVWRSNDAGLTWTKIWAKPSVFDMSGYLATPDGDPSTLYVSVGNVGVFRIDGARTGTVGAGLTAVPVVESTAAGPIAVQGSLVFAATIASGSTPPRLLVSDDRGSTWTDVADDTYRRSALFPRDLSLAPDGTVYVALNGAGLIRGTPIA